MCFETLLEVKFLLLFSFFGFLLTRPFFHPEEIIVHTNKEQEKDRERFTDKSTGLEMEQVIEPQSLLEWFAEKYKEFSANLEFVTSRSQEGAQFVKGFGGVGGLLRYKVDFQNLTSIDEDEDKFFSDDDGGI